MDVILAATIVVGFVIAIILPAVMICAAIGFYLDIKEKKFNEKHPEYIEFCKEYGRLQDESIEIWNSTMPDCRAEIEYCLGEIKYHSEYSQKYQYLNNKLNVARRQLEKCQDEYDKKENEIYQFVQANKSVIETIKDDDFNSYVSWVERFKLDKVE